MKFGLSAVSKTSIKIVKLATIFGKLRAVFRTILNIYDEVFSKNTKKLSHIHVSKGPNYASEALALIFQD